MLSNKVAQSQIEKLTIIVSFEFLLFSQGLSVCEPPLSGGSYVEIGLLQCAFERKMNPSG